jgi:antitoxin CptB
MMLATKYLSEVELRRLSWRCRRGMLELDIVLQRFAEQQLMTLDLAELSAFDVLLDFPDNEFLDVVTDKLHVDAAINTPAMQRLMSKLRNQPNENCDEVKG